jgi:hypothetical protein
LGPQAAAKLGLESEATAGVGGSEKVNAADLAGSAGKMLRLELKDGKPTALSTKTSVQFESSLSKTQSLAVGDIKLDFAKGVGASVRAEVARRVEFKPGMTPTDAARALQDSPATLTVGLESKKGSAFGESGAELEFKVEGEAGALLRAVWNLQHGDVSVLDVIDKAEVTAKRTASSGASFSIGAEVAGNGAGVALRGMRKRVLSQSKAEGSGYEMALQVLKALGGTPGDATPVTVPTYRPL